MAENGSPVGRVDLARQQATIDRFRAVKSALPAEQRRTTSRAVARVVEDTRLEGRLGKFTIQCDEPLDRGGDDMAPAPSQYLMAAVGF